MTLVSDIITDAFRQGNIVAIGSAPTTAESTEALRYLNRIAKSVLGNEVGDPLTSFPLGRANITYPTNYPLWDQNPGIEWVVPRDTRLNVNLTEAKTVYLHPAPDDGARFAVADAVDSLGTYALTVDGNGRYIEGAATLVLNTAGINDEWLYRADTGNWQKVSPLIETDAWPFPEEFDEFFISLLATKLNPSYGLQIDPQSQMMMSRARTQLRSRYKQNRPTRLPVTLGLIGPRRWNYQDPSSVGDYPGSYGWVRPFGGTW